LGGHNVFFVSTGSVEVIPSKDGNSSDNYFGQDSLLLLNNKHEKFGNTFNPGSHFGEYCLVSKAGLRVDSAKALVTTELFSLDFKEFEIIFSYFVPSIKRKFLVDLFTKILNCTHTELSQKFLNMTDEELKLDSTLPLYKYSFALMTEIIANSALCPTTKRNHTLFHADSLLMVSESYACSKNISSVDEDDEYHNDDNDEESPTKAIMMQRKQSLSRNRKKSVTSVIDEVIEENSLENCLDTSIDNTEEIQAVELTTNL
jgi:hypothetical protein